MSDEIRDGSVTIGDGRRISYRIFGAAPSDAFPVLALHGTPGSRLKFSVAEEPAAALGLSIIAPDRWGYGDTDPHPVPTLAAFAGDMAALADHLSLRRFAVMGVSGGGPFAAACAARLGQRVAALALVAPVGPMSREPDREISVFHRFCFGPLARRPGVSEAVFRTFRRLLLRSPDLAMHIAMLRVPSADRAILARGETRRRLALTFAEGLRSGAIGPTIDLELFGKPWGLPLANVTAPARLWLGSTDRNVPLSAARRLAERIPTADITELADQGHLWVAEHYGEVLGWIAATVQRPYGTGDVGP